MSQALIGSNEELEKFYKKKFYFSYSGINKLLFSPVVFYNHYVLNQREDSTDAHLVAGRVLHCLLFEEEKFDENFLELPGKMPTDSQRKIIYDLFKIHMSIGNNSLSLEDYSQDILNLLLTANLYQSLKTDQQRLDKILTTDHKEYFEFLKLSLSKAIVDQDTLSGCKVSVEILKLNTSVRALLQLDKTKEDAHITVHNELPLAIDVDNLSFGFKGILDNVVIDSESKTIFINDLKTTGKNLIDFPESVQYYKYWMQAVIYEKLVFQKFIKDLPDSLEWNIIVTFIVIDKYNQVYPFQVSQESLTLWQDNFEKIIDTVKYHYENKDYTLPYELAIGNLKL